MELRRKSKPCEKCGKEYTKNPAYSYKTFEATRFCSDQCRGRASRKAPSRESKKCERCGSTILREDYKSISQGRWDRKRFCARICGTPSKKRKEREETKRKEAEAAGRKCKYCGKELTRKQYRTKRESVNAYAIRDNCSTRECNPLTRGLSPKKIAPITNNPPNKIMYKCAKGHMGTSIDGKCPQCSRELRGIDE